MTRNFYVRGGISTIVNISNSTTFMLGDNSENKTRNTLNNFSSPNFRRFNFSGNLGFGVAFFQSTGFSLYAQTNIETNLLQLKKGRI